MDKRFLFALLLILAAVQLNALVWNWLRPPPPPVEVAEKDDAEKGKEAEKKPAEKQPAEKQPDDTAAPELNPGQEPAEPAEAAPQVEQEWYTLGSLDPASGFNMLVTLTNQGAAIHRVELNGPQYHEIEHKGGYLGSLEPVDVPQAGGVRVRVVGPGTPAAAAGIQPGDVIVKVAGFPVTDVSTYETALAQTEPGQEIEITLASDPAPRKATLISKPLSVISPSENAPDSLRMTLSSLNGNDVPEDADEFGGLAMLVGNWTAEQAGNGIEFRYRWESRKLTFIKRFRLSSKDERPETEVGAAYHVDMSIAIAYDGDQSTSLAYQLNGLNGLPTEGAWYAVKNSPYWTGIGLRDVVWKLRGQKQHLVSASAIADGELDTQEEQVGNDLPLQYVGVDAQYFAGVLLPHPDNPDEIWFRVTEARLAGEEPPDPKHLNLANTTFRMISQRATLSSEERTLEHNFRVFIGPKKPEIVAEYGLDELIYYGLFWFTAKPLVATLHFFYSIIPNYGIAIILLTVLVRLCMFPLSKRQALNAQKMQQIQPEMKRITEKYKSKPEERMRATQELYRKHNFNPMAGCLPMFIQLPIFVGLYRSLACTVELREAPLFGPHIAWASNLAAPDMLFRWDEFMPSFVVSFLGPYFNLFPLVTIALFLAQQKMFMPPAADEQARTQQKVMQYMMVFIGLMFFKVASGLCLYFIVSSLWGIAERKFLPKAAAAGVISDPTRSDVVPAGSGRFNGASDVVAKSKKQKKRQ